MTTNETCPHCGCSKYNDEIYWCNTRIDDPSKAYERRSIFCSKLLELKEQLTAQAAEIESLKQAVLDEREACAKICESHVCTSDCSAYGLGSNCEFVISAEIRARGEVK